MFNRHKNLGRYLKQFGEHDPVGYVIHALFDNSTSVEHAANDGIRFYKDNRRGSYRPWDLRFVPPFCERCNCFTQWIYETPLGYEYFGNFYTSAFVGGRKIAIDDIDAVIFDPSIKSLRCILNFDVDNEIGNPAKILPTDVLSVHSWFDSQPRNTKKRILGSDRYNAIVERTGEEPVLFDFVDILGEVLSHDQVRLESKGRRSIRTRGIKAIYDHLQRDHVTAWQNGGGKWDLNPNNEERFDTSLFFS